MLSCLDPTDSGVYDPFTDTVSGPRLKTNVYADVVY